MLLRNASHEALTAGVATEIAKSAANRWLGTNAPSSRLTRSYIRLIQLLYALSKTLTRAYVRKHASLSGYSAYQSEHKPWRTEHASLDSLKCAWLQTTHGRWRAGAKRGLRAWRIHWAASLRKMASQMTLITSRDAKTCTCPTPCLKNGTPGTSTGAWPCHDRR